MITYFHVRIMSLIYYDPHIIVNARILIYSIHREALSTVFKNAIKRVDYNMSHAWSRHVSHTISTSRSKPSKPSNRSRDDIENNNKKFIARIVFPQFDEADDLLLPPKLDLCTLHWSIGFVFITHQLRSWRINENRGKFGQMGGEGMGRMMFFLLHLYP